MTIHSNLSKQPHHLFVSPANVTLVVPTNVSMTSLECEQVALSEYNFTIGLVVDSPFPKHTNADRVKPSLPVISCSIVPIFHLIGNFN